MNEQLGFSELAQRLRKAANQAVKHEHLSQSAKRLIDRAAQLALADDAIVGPIRPMAKVFRDREAFWRRAMVPYLAQHYPNAFESYAIAPDFPPIKDDDQGRSLGPDGKPAVVTETVDPKTRRTSYHREVASVTDDEDPADRLHRLRLIVGTWADACDLLARPALPGSYKAQRLLAAEEADALKAASDWATKNRMASPEYIRHAFCHAVRLATMSRASDEANIEAFIAEHVRLIELANRAKGAILEDANRAPWPTAEGGVEFGGQRECSALGVAWLFAQGVKAAVEWTREETACRGQTSYDPLQASPEPHPRFRDWWLRLREELNTKTLIPADHWPVWQVRTDSQKILMLIESEASQYQLKATPAPADAQAAKPVEAAAVEDAPPVEPELTPSVEEARDQYLKACEQAGRDKLTKPEAYDLLHSAYQRAGKLSQLKPFPTWTRYIYKWERAIGQLRRKPRDEKLKDAGRKTIVRSRDL